MSNVNTGARAPPPLEQSARGVGRDYLGGSEVRAIEPMSLPHGNPAAHSHIKGIVDNAIHNSLGDRAVPLRVKTDSPVPVFRLVWQFPHTDVQHMLKPTAGSITQGTSYGMVSDSVIIG